MEGCAVFALHILPSPKGGCMENSNQSELLDVIELGSVTDLTLGDKIPLYLEGGTVAPFIYLRLFE